jgi:hypothetical protein
MTDPDHLEHILNCNCAEQFVQYYYETFDSNRAGLAGLYVRKLDNR